MDSLKQNKSAKVVFTTMTANVQVIGENFDKFNYFKKILVLTSFTQSISLQTKGSSFDFWSRAYPGLQARSWPGSGHM